MSTLLDPALFRRAKLEAARQGKQISEIVGEALEVYLRREDRGLARVDESWAVLSVDRDQLRNVMEEEIDFLET